jgi:hypothetical protein
LLDRGGGLLRRDSQSAQGAPRLREHIAAGRIGSVEPAVGVGEAQAIRCGPGDAELVVVARVVVCQTEQRQVRRSVAATA